MADKICGALGSVPWGTVKCTKKAGHGGAHSGKGLTWRPGGKPKIGRGKGR